MNPTVKDILMHYGIKRRSGRYPWGSGDSPYQHSGDFISRVEELERQGLNEKERAEALHLSTTDLRMQLRVAKHERRALEADRAQSLRDDGKTLNEIAEILGYNNDSSVRALLNERTRDNKNQAKVTAEILRKELDKKGILDVGAGVERELGISKGVLKEAVFILETEGNQVLGFGLKQVNSPGKQTITTVLCKPEVEEKYLYSHPDAIQSVGEYHSMDGGNTFRQLKYPASMDSKRIAIRYGDEGGLNKDGVIELRRGVKDLDLGNSRYAQVRILVDGTHYLKGMAMYADDADIPAGSDIVFNTNKKSGTPKLDVLKPIKLDDPDNPFGAAIKAKGQSTYIDDDGKEKLSLINKIKEEGDWDRMVRNLSSQFLSKQPMHLIQKQLDLTYKDAMDEYDEICSLNNKTVKRKMLLEFANECDAATVHLQAAALPRQSKQVILPLNCMKETEIYAPNYKNGETVVLVRYPHGGTFEIPKLVVNNKNKKAKSILGNVMDAVGINSKVAEQLSGADFDGDDVMVIPLSRNVRINTTKPLAGLKGFDPKTQYAYKEGIRVMKKSEVQREMGIISNLITDMTLKGANESEIVRAVKHSMVVIDAQKHELDYKQSEKDNGIAELKKAYQKHTDLDGNIKYGGASTLISNRKQSVQILETQGSGRIDPVTGKVVYKNSGRTYYDKKTGKYVPAMRDMPLISTVDDAYRLSSGTPQENAYASYANQMKSLANQARKEYTTTGRLKYSSSARATYQQQADELNAALNIAIKNAPRERRAQAIANSEIKAKQQSNPDMGKEELRKLSQLAIDKARVSVGATGKGTRIDITPIQWEAIQAGALSDSNLSEILRYADPDKVKQYATPRTRTQLSDAKIARIKAMQLSGYTNAEIAEQINVSTSTISNYLRGKE